MHAYIYELSKVACDSYLGNTVLRNDLAWPLSFLDVCNNQPHHIGVSYHCKFWVFFPGQIFKKKICVYIYFKNINLKALTKYNLL